MEHVEDSELTQEVFENDIELYLKLFCEERNIENMADQSQSVWNAALIYIKRHVFNKPNILKNSKPLTGYNNNNYNNQYKNLNNSNCNRYDTDKVNAVCDYYIYLCCLYDKEVSVIGFNNLTGIDDNTIYAWGHDERKLSDSGKEVYKKLVKYREESLSNKLVTGKQNPVGVLGVLNRHYQWNMPGVRDQATSKQALSAAELPKLGDVQQHQNAGMPVNTALTEKTD